MILAYFFSLLILCTKLSYLYSYRSCRVPSVSMPGGYITKKVGLYFNCVCKKKKNLQLLLYFYSYGF